MSNNRNNKAGPARSSASKDGARKARTRGKAGTKTKSSRTGSGAKPRTKAAARAKVAPKKARPASTRAAVAPKKKAPAKPRKKPALPIAIGRKKTASPKHKLRIVPLGGLQEIGKNMTALEYGNDIILIDCGMSFPDNDMLGIDVVIPDYSYIKDNKDRLRAVIITHGHEDHIGGVPFLLKDVQVPIIGTKLPIGLIRNKLDEHGIRGAILKNINAGDKIKIGCFDIEAIRTTHSIADSICLSIDTPVGRIFHTGDFKIDYTPVDGDPIDLAKLAWLGDQGVLLMMADSTNATRPGSTRSEKVVGKTLETIFKTAENRIIISTFSSNVHRIQKIVDHAVKYNRKIAFAGRSMLNVASLAIELGYLKIPKGSIVDIRGTRGIPDSRLTIITTGSQGEPMSALTRMANDEHRAITIKEDDIIILSSTPVPGNERMVSNVINKLIQKGAQVIYSDIADTHVSGHACQDELKLMHALIRPKYFMPVHGEYRHLRAAADIAIDMGKDEDDIFILENGDCLEIGKGHPKMVEDWAQAGSVMVDGLGIGDVGTVVLRDRKMLSESGLIMVACMVDRKERRILSGPEIVSRGFVYVREHEELMANARTIVVNTLEEMLDSNKKINDWNVLKNAIKDDLSRYIYQRTKRRPMIVAIFMEV